MVKQILTNRGEVAMIFKLKAILILFISVMVLNYSDTIRIYKVVLSNDSISKTIELNHKPNFNVGNIINYY